MRWASVEETDIPSRPRPNLAHPHPHPVAPRPTRRRPRRSHRTCGAAQVSGAAAPVRPKVRHLRGTIPLPLRDWSTSLRPTFVDAPRPDANKPAAEGCGISPGSCPGPGKVSPIRPVRIVGHGRSIRGIGVRVALTFNKSGGKLRQEQMVVIMRGKRAHAAFAPVLYCRRYRCKSLP